MSHSISKSKWTISGILYVEQRHSMTLNFVCISHVGAGLLSNLEREFIKQFLRLFFVFTWSFFSKISEYLSSSSIQIQQMFPVCFLKLTDRQMGSDNPFCFLYHVPVELRFLFVSCLHYMITAFVQKQRYTIQTWNELFCFFFPSMFMEKHKIAFRYFLFVRHVPLNCIVLATTFFPNHFFWSFLVQFSVMLFSPFNWSHSFLVYFFFLLWLFTFSNFDRLCRTSDS